MASLVKKKRIKKPIKLSSHDINVVSVIAQQASLPRDYLLRFAKDSGISPDAYSVIEVLLDNRKKIKGFTVKEADKKNATYEAASDFHEWAEALR